MRKIEYVGQFKFDFKREHKGRHGKTLDIDLKKALQYLQNDLSMPNQYHDHSLSGQWKDYRDCHIKPDLVLIYRKLPEDEILQLVRLGSHSELGL
jgi:mRNA interferase YafQ